MSKGVVIVANNVTSKDGRFLNYIAAAEQTARGVRHFLDVPVTLLTSDENVTANFDQIITIPKRKTNPRAMVTSNDTIVYDWDNDHRIDAFDYSPYDRTLLIDADYFVFSQRLLAWIDSDYPFMIMDRCVDPTGRDTYRNQLTLPDNSIPQLWATVMAWNKDAKPVFDAARMVRDNYEMYALMTGMPVVPFRNDVAFSIAAHLVEWRRPVPHSMQVLPADASVMPVLGLNDSKLLLEYPSPAAHTAFSMTTWSDADLHIINKNVVYDPNVLKIIERFYDNTIQR